MALPTEGASTTTLSQKAATRVGPEKALPENNAPQPSGLNSLDPTRTEDTGCATSSAGRDDY
eukprot:557212-Alexandrium_andersonii.AAC.1